jgi:cytochrome subunit of sulfide dehydrogenase
MPMSARILAATLAFTAAAVQAQDDAAGRSLAASCANCHGTEGRSATTEVASLAGLPKDYLIAQMRAFRDGTRPATVMQQLAKGYSDAQIELVADYFSRRRR